MTELGSESNSFVGESELAVPSPPILPEQSKMPAFTFDIHKYLREQITLADAKATFLFAAIAGLLTYLNEHGLVIPLGRLGWEPEKVLGLVAVLGLASSAVGALLVIMPRGAGNRKGYIFWRAVTLYPTNDAYVESVMKLDDLERQRAVLTHVYELASITTKKYGMLRVVWLMGIASIVVTALYMLIA